MDRAFLQWAILELCCKELMCAMEKQIHLLPPFFGTACGSGDLNKRA
jgi:hypothetical protein